MSETPTAGKPAPEENKQQAHWLSEVTSTIIIALFLMTFLVQAVEVPTGSMQNTILIGDRLLVNKFIFAPGPVMPFLPQREIRRGDIVVFKYPGNPHDITGRDLEPDNRPFSTNYVKRVIGLPGDRVELRGERVFINGELLPEQRIAAIDRNDDAPVQVINAPPRGANEDYTIYYNPQSYGDDSMFRYGVGGETAVPANHYFVMGDNRDNSLDSRAWGFVPRDLIIGRPMFVLWSVDRSEPASGNPMTNFFSRARWSRIGTFIR